MLELYRRYIEHAAGGLGPFIVFAVLFLLVEVPLYVWEKKLAREIGSVLAARRTSWPGALWWLVLVLVVLYCYAHA